MYVGGPVPETFIRELKKLEDKILELEGISPEYFQSIVSISVFKKKISVILGFVYHITIHS